MEIFTTTCKTVLTVLFAMSCITWAVAAPATHRQVSSKEVLTNSSELVNDSASAEYYGSGDDSDEYDFNYDCSIERPLNYSLSNDTYLDFSIGLNIMKTHLKGVASDLNATIANEDRESFVICYPAPVNTKRLVQLNDLGSNGTTTERFAAWHGVLGAYTRYTAQLLEEEEVEDEMSPTAEIKITKVYEMMNSLLGLFSDIVGPYSCASDDFETPSYEYNDDPTCTETFTTLKFATNMVGHLQKVISDIIVVKDNWSVALAIRRNLQTSRRALLRSTWISRYTNDSSC